MAKIDVGKLKEQALKAVEKRNYARAAELYLQIAQHEGDADWRQRAGEALRKAGDPAAAIEQFVSAAEGYAQGGFLLKAIAVCKVVLQIDAKHTATQARLADLFSLRDRGTRTPSGQVALVNVAGVSRTQRPQEAPPARSVVPAPPPAEPPVAPSRPISLAADLAALDTVPLDEAPRGRTLPPGAPMEVVALHQVLGGRASGEFPVVDGDAAVEVAGPGAYEIELGADDLDLSEMAVEGIALEVEPPPAASPAPRDELDFSGLLDDAPAPRPAAAPARPAAPPAEPPPGLARIPLFSSLAPDRLRHLIERVELRHVGARDLIVRQGEQGGSLFVIARGQVEVVVEGPPRRTLAHLGEGQFFGELALLTDAPRSATVRADEPTELLEISRELASEIIADSPDVLKTLLRFFRDRMLDRLLSTSPLFSSLSESDARVLVDRFKFLELEAGLRVVREGERAPGLFLLLCGEARVVRGARPLAPLKPGDVFGEISLLRGGTAAASIETVSKCWVLELERAHFQEIMLTYPQILEYVSEVAAKRQAGSDDRVDFI